MWTLSCAAEGHRDELDWYEVARSRGRGEEGKQSAEANLQTSCLCRSVVDDPYGLNERPVRKGMRGALCCCADVLDVGRCHRHAEGTSATAYCDDVVIATDYDG